MRFSSSRTTRTTTLTFERPKDFSLERFDDEGRFSFGQGKKVALIFRIRKDVGLHLLETPLSTDQTFRELSHDYEIKATVVDSEQLKWWLRSFGDSIRNIRKRAA
jgi:WYL domain